MQGAHHAGAVRLGPKAPRCASSVCLPQRSFHTPACQPVVGCRFASCLRLRICSTLLCSSLANPTACCRAKSFCMWHWQPGWPVILKTVAQTRMYTCLACTVAHADHRRRVIDEFDGVVSHLDGALCVWAQHSAPTGVAVCVCRSACSSGAVAGKALVRDVAVFNRRSANGMVQLVRRNSCSLWGGYANSRACRSLIRTMVCIFPSRECHSSCLSRDGHASCVSCVSCR